MQIHFHNTSPNRPVAARAIMPVGLMVMSVLLGACAERALTEESNLEGARVQLVSEVDPRLLILVDPHRSILEVNYGVNIRARVVDANGNIIPDAKPTWRTTDASVAALHPLPDSAHVPGARISIVGVSPGDALVIASYQRLADTTVVTVHPSVDTVHNPVPAPEQPPRPTTFNAAITVRGLVTGPDSASTGSPGIPGASVTLTLLPPVAGDSLPPGVTPVAAPTVFATVLTDAESRAVFSAVPQSRFRVDVVPPSGTPWQSATFTSGVPQVASYARIVTLQK